MYVTKGSPTVGSAPVMTVPPGYPIAARPRREDVYDTALAGQGTLVFFQGAPFAGGSPPPKFPGLDTNFIGASLPRGHYLRVFGAQAYITRRQTAVLTGASVNLKMQLWDMAFFRLLMGSTPYLDAPLWRVPSGTGMTGALATGEVVPVTAGACMQQMGMPICTCYLDLTVPGKIRKQTPRGVQTVSVSRIPIEFSETESFAVNVVYPTVPAIVGAIPRIQIVLKSIWLKPLAC